MRRAFRERIYLTASEVLEIIWPYIENELGYIPEQGLVRWHDSGDWCGFSYDYDFDSRLESLPLEDYLWDYIEKTYGVQEDPNALAGEFSFYEWLGRDTRKENEILKPGDEFVFYLEIPVSPDVIASEALAAID